MGSNMDSRKARGAGRRSPTGFGCCVMKILLLAQAALILLSWKSDVFSSSKDSSLHSMDLGVRESLGLKHGEIMTPSSKQLNDLGIRFRAKGSRGPEMDDVEMVSEDNQGLTGAEKVGAASKERDEGDAPGHASIPLEAPELFSELKRQKALARKEEEDGTVEKLKREVAAMATIVQKNVDYDPELFREKLLNKKHWLFYIRIQKTGSETMWKALLQVRRGGGRNAHMFRKFPP